MNKYPALAIATFLAAFAVPLAANAFVAWDESANVAWQGPGYYVVDAGDYAADMMADDHSHTDIMAGPFADEADCKAAVAARHLNDDDFKCLSYATEKDSDRP